ncbi:hypothetical protein LTS15_010264 [Exophiala xenobiotica]|nr:hypothetical protein LTS15_010264 [Exophiala xenobiotica]
MVIKHQATVLCGIVLITVPSPYTTSPQPLRTIDINIRDFEGRTAIQYTSIAEIQALLERLGADPRVSKEDETNPDPKLELTDRKMTTHQSPRPLGHVTPAALQPDQMGFSVSRPESRRPSPFLPT